MKNYEVELPLLDKHCPDVPMRLTVGVGARDPYTAVALATGHAARILEYHVVIEPGMRVRMRRIW